MCFKWHDLEQGSEMLTYININAWIHADLQNLFYYYYYIYMCVQMLL